MTWIKYKKWFNDYKKHYCLSTSNKTILEAELLQKQYKRVFNSWKSYGWEPEEGDTILLFYIKRKTKNINYMGRGDSISAIVGKRINGELYVNEDMNSHIHKHKGKQIPQWIINKDPKLKCLINIDADGNKEIK